MAVATPTTLGVDPLRTQNAANEEQKIHLMYGFLYVADAEEGLIVIGNQLDSRHVAGVGTLLDGNPANNFLTRAVTFNPNGVLTGARRIVLSGHYAYVLTARGLVVVDLNNPLATKVTAAIGAPDLDDPRGLAIQFRYAFVVDRAGLKVLDLTALDHPRVVSGAAVTLADARNVYLSRTYAYVAGGPQGLVIVDIERPELPRIDQVFTADVEISDLRDVKIGMVSASGFAFLADAEHGLRVVQLFSPEENPNHYGFSPRPTPSLIATYHTHEPALAVSEGIDRDRAVDESGNQLAGFGRRGGAAAERRRAAPYVHAGRPALHGDERAATRASFADVARHPQARCRGSVDESVLLTEGRAPWICVSRSGRSGPHWRNAQNQKLRRRHRHLGISPILLRSTRSARTRRVDRHQVLRNLPFRHSSGSRRVGRIDLPDGPWA